MFEALLNRTLKGGIPLFLMGAGLLAGIISLQLTPREEEPQIVVPMVSVSVSAPGLSAAEVDRQVTTPLEKLLAQIRGVEHVYAVSATASAEVTLRFYVGEDREDSLLNTYNKLHANQDQIPAVVGNWFVKPIEVDDLAIVLLGLWSEDPDLYSDFHLRRMADEIATFIQAIPNTNVVSITGGRARVVRIDLDPEAMAARQTTVQDISTALRLSNRLDDTGDLVINDRVIRMESGDNFRSLDEVSGAVINVINGVPVHLRDVATVRDDREIATRHQWLMFGPGHSKFSTGVEAPPMVTIGVAKKRGTNAVQVARDVHDLIAELQQEFLPEKVHVEVLRDYGQTANDKVNNLVLSLAFAVLTVVVFIGIFLGWRPAIVVAFAVPICYGLTLALDYAFGYTINRVTLFALILSLGLLVDDPITGVDNIERFLRSSRDDIRHRIVMAMSEIRVALLVSTLTIILAFVPLAFITGMMGPYMKPMAFNVPVSVTVSTLVAFLVTPWLARIFLRKADYPGDDMPLFALYSRIVSPFLTSHARARQLLYGVLGLFLVAALLPAMRLVPLKLLPFDNKSELQVLIDLPEGASLEATAAEAWRVADLIRTLPEVEAVGVYAGAPSPDDFNGMVRGYQRRVAPHLADLRVTLVPKDRRVHQSHAIVLRLRALLKENRSDRNANIKVIEVPPGPPVLDTLVAEVYGARTTPYEQLRTAAERIKRRMAAEPHVVQIDSSVEEDQQLLRFIADREKAALSGISVSDINETLRIANAGTVVSYMKFERESVPLPVIMRIPVTERSSQSDLLRLQVGSEQELRKLQGETGLDRSPRSLVPVGELGRFEHHTADKTIHHKDLRPLVYVTAELSGRTPAEVISDLHHDFNSVQTERKAWNERTYIAPGGGIPWSLPDDIEVKWSGEGEWRITLRVFRDMGLGFLFALIAIFCVLTLQTGSTALALIIMSSIPLTIIGIMPGFWLLNQIGEREVAGAPDPVLFTATAMIGMIALAGIVVRNSLILVEFIEQARRQGSELKEALLTAGAVRMRPVLLTAGTTLLGNIVITLDPVFSGLALAIIFGILSSTLFTLIVVPVVYYLVFDDRESAAEAASP